MCCQYDPEVKTDTRAQIKNILVDENAVRNVISKVMSIFLNMSASPKSNLATNGKLNFYPKRGQYHGLLWP